MSQIKHVRQSGLLIGLKGTTNTCVAEEITIKNFRPGDDV